MSDPQKKTEIIEAEPTALPAQAVTPMQMLQIAVEQGADLDRLEKLMDMQERWEANEARKAFADFQFAVAAPFGESLDVRGAVLGGHRDVAHQLDDALERLDHHLSLLVDFDAQHERVRRKQARPDAEHDPARRRDSCPPVSRRGRLPQASARSLSTR